MAAGQAYKARTLELLALQPGASALDVACGLGDDVVRMRASGAQALGVDRSRTLIAAAQSRHAGSGCPFTVADAAALPFPDASFEAVRIDRALQHIAEPGRIVGEMARVARRGGVVLCAEPDWGTFLLGGPHTVVSERIQHTWIRSFQNPWIGRELPTHGFAESDLLFEIEANARQLSAELPEAIGWLETYRRSEAYAGVLMLICWGRKR